LPSVSAVFRAIRKAIEFLAALFLLLLQYIPYVGWITPMIIPLLPWIAALIRAHPADASWNINHLISMLFTPRATLSWAFFIAGLVIFSIAFVHYVLHLLFRRSSLLRTGLYSVIRHPQYLGIALATFGLSITSILFVSYSYPRLGMHTIVIDVQIVSTVLGAWFLQVTGFFLLAAYEEKHLLREFGDEYAQYKQDVPFILPFSRLTRIPEPFFSAIVVITFLLLVLLMLDFLYCPILS
jgi:protein-S-isoprenylcysteine O-methyltransferase Ste14